MRKTLQSTLLLSVLTLIAAGCGGGSPLPTGGSGKADSNSCTTDADCGPGSICVAPPCAPEATSCPSYCQATSPPPGSCTTDADCGPGSICVAPPCAPEATSCPSYCQTTSPPPGSCTTDADCSPGSICVAPPCAPEATSCPSYCQSTATPPPFAQ